MKIQNDNDGVSNYKKKSNKKKIYWIKWKCNDWGFCKNWSIWKRYTNELSRDMAYEVLINTHGNSIKYMKGQDE